ncbi:sphingosine-1-phosphate lyase [Eupeodes corollae]|uniref:sphingosine-1-phosphate lyase n=1 Tax=Eupeodes corollae TaxID=290404 RepID=UPI002492809F|nr:sphingosine-1-phosphate lyase [Eupeodes corollae]XP_055917559.1 sphingosine-1-phosphate lyase [Eupeodes corollae]XP_055917560.1 sphingosine-1-phosphate lyase [Eupeodes corollae]
MENCAKVLTKGINNAFGNREPWQIMTITAINVLTTVWLWNFINQDESVYRRTKKYFFRLLKKLPMVKARIQKEIGSTRDEFRKDMVKRCDGLVYSHKLPEKGFSKEEIFALVDQHIQKGNYDWQDGRVSGTVYGYDPDVVDLITKVYGKASYTNPLHPDIFPGICKMEAEVVKMISTLFNGDENTSGTMTTGGTESILLACKAYRDYAREVKGITKPNMIVPKSAHAAFDKAGQFLGIHVRSIKLNPKTTEVDLTAFKNAINSNTIMLVGSAPNFPYGTMDDIEEIGKLGAYYNIPVHVDACLGSFVIGYMKKAGYYVRPFDFSVKGVTSISVDTHKYGFAPKGSSVIIYTEEKFRDHQFTVTTDWPGGVYGSPTVNGSRAGGIIAACWATMMMFGEEGYLEATKRILDTSRFIEDGLRKIKGIHVIGKPATTVIAIGSEVFEIFRLSDALSKIGWSLNILQFPSGIHICVTDMHTKNGVAAKFLADTAANVAEILKDPGRPVEGKLAIYGAAQTISDRSLVGDVTRNFLSAPYYIPEN